MAEISDEELEGLEHYLTGIQQYLDEFDEEDAVSNFAGSQGYPSDGTFGGPLMCGKDGYKISKGEPLLDKEGNPENLISDFKFSNTTKFPYLCKNQDLFKMSQIPDDQKHFDINNPEWLGIVINSQNNSFLSNYARNKFGKKLCTNLSKIIGCETPPSYILNPPVLNTHQVIC